MRNRKAKEKQELTRLIQKTAIKIINEEGFDQLSMRKIANTIDYTPTTIYSYFENKDAIIRSIANDIYNEVIENILQAFEANQHKEPIDLMEIIIRTFINTMLKEPETIRCVLQSSYNMFEEGEVDPRHDVLDQFLIRLEENMMIRDFKYTKLLMIVNILGFTSFVANRQLTKGHELDTLIDAFVNTQLYGMCGR